MSCEACVTLPATVTDYTPKGSYSTYADVRTYEIRNSSRPVRCLIGVYDIFGLHANTLQGADRLSILMPETLLLVPDFFDGEPLAADTVPTNTPEKKEMVSTFLKEKAGIDENLELLLNVAENVKQRYPDIASFGVYGLCWGGKLAIRASIQGSIFKASAAAHPGRLEVSDARSLAIPHICLFSGQDGAPDVVAEYSATLEKVQENQVHHYPAMHHGWMGARAKLVDPDNVKAFESGYGAMAQFMLNQL